MLQLIAKENDKYSIPELIQMTVEGGCGWVQLITGDASDEEIRELAKEVVPLCQETSTILTIENHLELAKELGIHGVLLIDAPVSAPDAREFCGPEAIIGVQVNSAMDVVPLRNKDVDFIVFPTNMDVDQLKLNVEAVRSAEIDIPLVAAGDYSVDQLPEIMATGVSGVALSAAIVDADDPTEATRQILKILKP